MKRLLMAVGLILTLPTAPAAHAAPHKATPYWASISENEARMRVGPSLDFPSSWVYRRRDLPVKVVQVLGLWRKVEDADGTQGWMHVRLLSDAQTAIVTAPIAPIRESRTETSRALFRAEKGVVGRVSGCSSSWCSFDVKGKKGFVKVDDIWGAI